ncbi:hypothetical protein NC651_020176 [Populus alba x Populus x berolinensis]|nr:hypothetical protein NC651_020176 [Populus alba x Populus x berolinensis]
MSGKAAIVITCELFVLPVYPFSVGDVSPSWFLMQQQEPSGIRVGSRLWWILPSDREWKCKFVSGDQGIIPLV